MDPKVVDKLNQAFVKAIKSKPMAERFDKMGAVEKAGTPAQLNDFVKSRARQIQRNCEDQRSESRLILC